MPPARKADVIVVVDRDSPDVSSCLQSVLESSGPVLGRLVVIDDGSAAPELVRALEQIRQADRRVLILRQHNRPGRVDAFNLGLSHRQGDAVVLSAATVVTPGWLAELAEVAHSEDRTACASPLTTGAGICLFQDEADTTAGGGIDRAASNAACSGLPRSTTTPRLDGSCVYFRGEMIDAVGLLDATFTSLDPAIDDWVMRGQTLGFFAKLANHAYVQHRSSPDTLPGDDAPLDRSAEILEQRHPQLRPQVELFGNTLNARLANHALRFEATGKLRVAYDIRHMPPENVGTRTYAVNLAKALAGLPDIDLTLLVRTPVQAEGLEGDVVTEQQWRDDVAVIHKPAQVFSRAELALLFGSSAHVVITYQDLIAYRIPVVFSSDDEFEAYRATSNLSLLAAQRILAYSESSGREISSEFGIPPEEVVVVPLGVEAEWFAHRELGDVMIRRKLKLPRRYFFSLATDYPHKNLSTLLDAYALLRDRWRGGKPPGLVLAGYAIGARARLYDGMEPEVQENGLTYLGPVSPDELRVLYQNAEALVFPSLYEGFGLPPLEAMAAGTPVVAMPFSSIPEVGGDAVLYTEGLSIANLAQAMERLAASDALQADLRDRGLKRAEQFRWEKTARAVFETYRSAVQRPSERSLQARRLLREAILHWSGPGLTDLPVSCGPLTYPLPFSQPIGVRNAWRALNVAVHTRLWRELRRLGPVLGHRSA